MSKFIVAFLALCLFVSVVLNVLCAKTLYRSNFIGISLENLAGTLDKIIIANNENVARDDFKNVLGAIFPNSEFQGSDESVNVAGMVFSFKQGKFNKSAIEY